MFGDKLKSLRDGKGLSQAALAKLVGVKQPYITDLESGNRHPSIELLKKLAEHLGVPFRELVFTLPPDHAERVMEEHIIPKYGLIAAGPVGEAACGEPDRIDMRTIVPPECFLLEVHGSSVSGLGVHSGDLIAVQPNAQPENGDLVVAEIDGGYTLKAFWDGRLWECRNGKKSKPIDIDGAENVIVKGVVKTVLGARRFPPPGIPRR